MRDIPLGLQTTRSGNRCVAGLGIKPATKITVSFTWERPPSADDREEWSYTILAATLDRALDEAFLERTAVEATRKLVAEGVIERVGISRAGDWLFSRTKAAARLPDGVVSLTAKRRERQAGLSDG